MCETSFAYYGTARFEGKREFHLGTVGAADETEAREQLLALYRTLFDGVEPLIEIVHLGFLSAVNERRPYRKFGVEPRMASCMAISAKTME